MKFFNELFKKVKPIYIILGLFIIVIVVSALGSKKEGKEGMDGMTDPVSIQQLKQLADDRDKNILVPLINLVQKQKDPGWDSTAFLNNLITYLDTYSTFKYQQFVQELDENKDDIIIVDKITNNFIRDNNDLSGNVLLASDEKLFQYNPLKNTLGVQVAQTDVDNQLSLIKSQLQKISNNADIITINKLIGQLIVKTGSMLDIIHPNTPIVSFEYYTVPFNLELKLDSKKKTIIKDTGTGFSLPIVASNPYTPDDKRPGYEDKRRYRYDDDDDDDRKGTWRGGSIGDDGDSDGYWHSSNDDHDHHYRRDHRGHADPYHGYTGSHQGHTGSYPSSSSSSSTKAGSADYWKKLYLNSVNNPPRYSGHTGHVGPAAPGPSLSGPSSSRSVDNLTGTDTSYYNPLFIPSNASKAGTGTSTGTGTGTKADKKGGVGASPLNTDKDLALTNQDMYLLSNQDGDQSSNCPVSGCGTAASCPNNLKPASVPPCPPCERCPEPSFECKKVPKYNRGENNQYLPKPVLADFSQFGM
jgi:hypothetical protein